MRRTIVPFSYIGRDNCAHPHAHIPVLYRNTMKSASYCYKEPGTLWPMNKSKQHNTMVSLTTVEFITVVFTVVPTITPQGGSYAATTHTGKLIVVAF